MELLGRIARAETMLVITGLWLAVGVFLLDGRIRTTGLLSNKATGEFDPGRLQMLLATLFMAGLMFARLDEMRQHHVVSLGASPLLYLLGGSHGIYLVRKVLQSPLARLSLRRGGPEGNDSAVKGE